MILKINQHTRATFVRHAVKEVPVTTKIIDTVLSYFPKSCICIAGYLDTSDQYWKVNYHWDLLVSQIDELIGNPVTAETVRDFGRAIKNTLLSNPPSPISGYRKDRMVGATKDQSSAERVVARHKLLAQSKRDFEQVLIKAKVSIPRASSILQPLKSLGGYQLRR